MGNELSQMERELSQEISSTFPESIGNPETETETFSDTSHVSRIEAEMKRKKRQANMAVINKDDIRGLTKKRLAVHARTKLLKKTKSLRNDFIPPVYPKTDQTITFIRESLSTNFLYECLDEEERKIFIDCMSKEIVKRGVDIIKQGDSADYFYLVDSGKVVFVIDGEEVGGCGRGGSFGELSLLYNVPRAATCHSKTKTILWKIHHRTFRHMMASKAINEKNKIIGILKKVSIMSHLQDFHLEKIADALELKSYSWGENIVEKGENGNHFYIVKEGTIKVHEIGYGDSVFEDVNLGEGDFFGEIALLTGEPRKASVTAVTDCSMLRLSKDVFHETIGNYENVMKGEIRKKILMTAPIFARSNLESNEVDKLLPLFLERAFEAGTAFVRTGESTCQPCFCIIEEGSVRVFETNGTIVNLIKGDHFGGEYLLSKDGKYERTIEFTEKTTLAMLRKSSIESVILSTSRLRKFENFVKTFPKITTNDLYQYRVIGGGDSGTVRFVTHNKTLKPYALKKISKRKIITGKKLENIIREKNILASLVDNPFTVNIITKFQDSKHVYFVYDFVPGGELFKVAHNSTGLNVPQAMFYTASIVLCFSQLFDIRVCYRDLKTENVLIDNKGYCVLIDFGEAKIISDKTFTFCGTPEYLAPEVILCKGHNHAVDIWSIGIFLYELLTSSTPFYSNEIDDVTLFKRIVKGKYTFPENGKFTDDSRDLIKRLLKKKPVQRLGCLAEGMEGIKNHSFFKTMDWNSLSSRELVAPWIPNLEGDMDLSYYDVYPELESQELEENLTEEEQRLFEDF